MTEDEYSARVRQEYTERLARQRHRRFYGHLDFGFWGALAGNARGNVYQAAQDGEMDKLVSDLIQYPETGINASYFNRAARYTRETALHAAVRRRQTEVVCLLLALGADVNADSAAEEGLHSPLHEALMMDFDRPINVGLVRLLLASGADANQRYFDRQDDTGMDNGPACNIVLQRADLLHPNLHQKNLKVIDLLISHGLDVNMMPGTSAVPKSFAYQALKFGGLGMLKWAASRGAAVSDADFGGFCLDNQQRGESRYGVEDYFIELGFQDTDFKILPHLTHGPGIRTKEDFVRLVGLLLANLPESAFDQMPQVLFEAVQRNDLALVEFWLDWGVDANAWRGDGVTLLLLAVSPHRLRQRVANPSIVELLLERGADVNAVEESSGRNALHLALVNSAPDHLDVLARLLAGGVDPDAKNGDGDTPLLEAVKRVVGGAWGYGVADPRERDCLIDCIHLLAKNVEDINAADRCRKTALHLLACKGRDLPRLQRVAVILLQRGIRADLRDHRDLTAGDVFRQEFAVELELHRALSGQL
ncbi:hypothetical protein MAPG_08670 [Magnaporthiopsis poae ATCC 64411]|uniref:Uncharacterized protein n=1 Tax=Magnaporthiopsis poae (strain ATCC 64411 / 73-15) TaxID=644358 RepID=A0A0C4E7Y8_MAGP6|nr:hypothetical protein MAPG_08670 [Magnaporthiopsis poae ATCC 64411]